MLPMYRTYMESFILKISSRQFKFYVYLSLHCWSNYNKKIYMKYVFKWWSLEIYKKKYMFHRRLCSNLVYNLFIAKFQKIFQTLFYFTKENTFLLLMLCKEHKKENIAKLQSNVNCSNADTFFLVLRIYLYYFKYDNNLLKQTNVYCWYIFFLKHA